MGWVDVDEENMANDRLAETVNECIASLAEQRKDLWVISETWGEVRMLSSLPLFFVVGIQLSQILILFDALVLHSKYF